jgi:hypothetical protein
VKQFTTTVQSHDDGPSLRAEGEAIQGRRLGRSVRFVWIASSLIRNDGPSLRAEGEAIQDGGSVAARASSGLLRR